MPWRLLFWPWTWPCSDPFPRVVAQGLTDSPEPWDRHLLASLTLSEEPRIVPAVTFYWVSLNVWFPLCPLSSVPRHKLPESWLTRTVPGRPCLSWFPPAPAGASLCHPGAQGQGLCGDSSSISSTQHVCSGLGKPVWRVVNLGLCEYGEIFWELNLRLSPKFSPGVPMKGLGI